MGRPKGSETVDLVPIYPVLKTAWLHNLRSGEYEQCIGVMNDGVGYCPLGVLYETVMELELIPVDKQPLDDPDSYAKFSYNGATGMLERNLMKYMGLSHDRSIWLGKRPGALNSNTSVVGMNDGGATFEEIADRIEGVR